MVGVLGGSVLFVLTALHANFVGFLSTFVTLTSHSCFVRGELVASEENTINGDFLSVLKDDDIADADEVVVKVIDRTSTQNLNLIKKKVLRSREIKLSDVVQIYNAHSPSELLMSQKLASNTYNVAFLIIVGTINKFDLLSPVLYGSITHNDSDYDQNHSTINPC